MSEAGGEKILVLRLSAMGDVALLAPVFKSFTATYPKHTIVLVTRPKFAVFFDGFKNVRCFPADVDKHFSGFLGIFRLFFSLRPIRPTLVIDAHDHLRTRLISFLFRLSGTKIFRFDKGRAEKKEITRKHNKKLHQLKHTVERYADAFLKAGFALNLLSTPAFAPKYTVEENTAQWLASKNISKTSPWIGVAPFAAHVSKIWPLDRYERVIEKCLSQANAHFFLFGGGKPEVEFFETLVKKFPNHCTCVAGQLKLPEEMALMTQLDLMLCTDSSNMHLAALNGVPTLSIWGGTHPATGFGPWGSNHQILQTDALPCRPCSVFGTATCHRGDFACLTSISEHQVVATLLEAIAKDK